MARPYETSEHHPHRWTGVIRTLVLFVLTLAVVGYLVHPGRQERPPERTIEAFCQQLKSVESFDQALAELDPVAVAAAIPQLEKLEQVAPNEILVHVKLIVDTTRTIQKALRQAQSDETALDSAWRAEQPDVARIQSAGKALHDYALTNCKIDLAATATTRPLKRVT